MAEIVKLKLPGDYTEHIIIKEIDGKPVKYVSIDEMTEEQFRQYCRDTGFEYFQRLGITLKS